MPMPPYPPTSTTTPVAYPPSTTSQQQSTGTISEEHIHASLLSAVEDKMKKRLREVLSQAQAEMEVLKKTHDDLNTGKNKLDSILVSLQGEQTAMEKNLAIMKEKNQEMKDLISKLEGEEAMDLDEAVVTTAPLYKQLLNAHAQENATEDAIYYLGEALRKEVIDLDIFLKHVRELSRSQFMLKALMQKTRQKAGLPY
ncbi:TSG101 [Cordylochernes scorpioides]|uniref:TSG101 n=1 Tax=Cordylochernes scorpioides TaxID=51811 RepID=A0ABY6L5J3_9ARAC|nr:TSG101 [Cordylochernes scorpioides]